MNFASDPNVVEVHVLPPELSFFQAALKRPSLSVRLC
jgi:hypothetical protein